MKLIIGYRYYKKKTTHPTAQFNIMFPLHPFPISCPPSHPIYTKSILSCPTHPLTTQCPHFPVLPLTFPLHNSAPLFTPHPYPTPPLVYHIPSINSPPSPTLLSGEVTWMMLCSSSELIQLHLTLSPCKTNQCTSWVNQSFSENQICVIDIKSYTCRSNPKINARK